MKLIFVVDEKAVNLAADLNSIAKRDRLPMTVVPLLSPEILFKELKGRTPDLVLLHHHWPGITIAELLERIAGACSSTRVIVFTGQPVDEGELISCVRFGVADYWTKRGQLDPTTVFRRLDYYCSDAEWTISALRRPSGSLEQLLTEANRSLETGREVTRERDAAINKVNAISSVERGEMLKTTLRLGELAVGAVIVTAMLILVNSYTSIGFWGAVAVVVVYAVFFLFLGGRISEVVFKWRGASATVKGTK